MGEVETAAGQQDDGVASAAHQRVLAAVADRADDRPELHAQLARAALRRVPAEQLERANPTSIAAQLHDLFELIDRREPGRTVVRAQRPETGFDGREAGTVLQLACEDRPFLLSTVTEELERDGMTVVYELHPIVGVERDDDGRLVTVGPARTAQSRESLLHLELDRHLDDERAQEVVDRLHELVDDVIAVTGDHEAMLQRLAEVAGELRERSERDGGHATDPGEDSYPDADPDEVAALLEWLLEDDFVMLGLREYDVLEHEGRRALQVVRGAGLGLLADDATSSFAEPTPVDELPREIGQRLDSSRLVAFARTRRTATVQRQVPMEDVRILCRDEEGRARRVVRLLGLFTRKGLAAPAAATPVLRGKLDQILEREDVVRGSHDEITLVSLFEALPKDELLRSSTDELHRTLVGLLHAEEHHELRVLVRVDHELGAVTVLITTPRDTWSPQLREQLEDLLEERYHAHRAEVDVALGDRQAAVGRFLLHVEGEIPAVSITELQADIRRIARPWIDTTTSHLVEQFGKTEGDRLARAFATRLPEVYRHSVPPEAAVEDVVQLDQHRRGHRTLLVAVRPADANGLFRVKAAKRGAPLVLSAFLPILESLGLEVVEEVPYRLIGEDETLHDFGVRLPGVDLDDPRLGELLSDTIHACWEGHAAADSLNRLVLCAGMPWRDVTVLRAYRRYRRQVGTAHTPEYVNDVLVAEHEATARLLDHFHARFDPDTDEQDRDAHREAVVEACDHIQRLDHDRIVRGMLGLVDATVRTNAYRTDAVSDGAGVPYLALKLDPSLVPDVPAPVPHREIFVFSPEVEGVHLRADAVARGGLRWSDRRDDVRTEVLDLVKAQIRKNALIVPTGAKGGFVLAREPDDPDDLREAVRGAYTTFVRGMLDVTDNLDDETPVPPERVVRHDADDPYLVVAADRGTATFSDTANALAERYDFWLGDAFASGGSNGYDHKELGVTARGTWVAVQRHFRELGVDVQSDPVTVAGVGDMSGDVFGNGLLSSRSLQLVAAFDHRHIFLDPSPDPEASFEERLRLFNKPRSTWDDYDRDLISEGGGVHPRTLKSIPLSDPVRELLRVDDHELSAPRLMRAILSAPVDLLFAGGIGTYVKASHERHEDAGDRTNDEIRVDADAVRARMIAEGANLFITQPGRIQYARRGGRADQDAVHNAAGVATSDHEVNVKILLNLGLDAGRIDHEERSQLLREVSEEVVDEVLRDVDSQTAALSRELEHSPEAIGAYQVLLSRLDDREEFDREVETLPDEDLMLERGQAGAGLTRPELATLLAWAKREIKEDLLRSEVPDAEVLASNLPRYFPPHLVERFGDLLPRHPLRRELISTVVTNELVDRMGVSFASTSSDERGLPLAQVVLAWEVARQILDADHYQAGLDALEGDLDPRRVMELHDQLRRLLSRVTATLLADPAMADPSAVLERTHPVARTLIDSLLTSGSDDQRRARIAHARWLVDDLVPQELARLLASARDLVIIPDVATVSEALPERSTSDIADAFLRLSDALGIDELERAVEQIEATTGWARRQRRGLETDLRQLRRDAASAALRSRPDLVEREAVEALLEWRAPRVERARQMVEDATRADDADLDALAVAARAIAEIPRI